MRTKKMKNRRKANKWMKLAKKHQKAFSMNPGGPNADKHMKKSEQAYNNYFKALGG